MLDEFKDRQKIAYQTIINSCKKDSFSHAYLVEISDIKEGHDFVNSIAKFILCPKHNSNSNNCNDCNQCNLIDENNFIEFKRIVAAGNSIKKHQLRELQNEFSRKALTTQYKIYVIEEAEKMNEENSNLLLKFLEEPPAGIIAILMTNNIYQILGTIKSRCQIITMKKKKQENLSSTIKRLSNYLYSDLDKKNLFEENSNDKIEIILEYVNYYETNGLKSIIFKNKSILSIIDDDFTLLNLFQILILIYKDILNKLLKRDLDYFIDYTDIIEKISYQEDLIKITKKINVLIDLSTKIKYNVNANLLLDKLIIDMEA